MSDQDKQRPGMSPSRPAGGAEGQGHGPKGASVNRREWVLQGGTFAALGLMGLANPRSAQAEPEPTALERIRKRGALVVAIYKDNPPFFDAGQGIELSMAEALAAELGVKLSLLAFNADENMNDDLRNMVWRGHYLGHGPADVMLHVPVDRPLMENNPRVSIFGPYYRERIMLARDLEKLPRLDSLADLKDQRVAVPGQTLAGWLMIGAEGGAYRNQLVTTWRDGVAAAKSVLKGEHAVAAGMASELESVLGGNPRYAIEAIPVPRAPKDGWAVGCAVKKDAPDLAQALQRALNTLADDGRMAQMFKTAGVTWRRP